MPIESFSIILHAGILHFKLLMVTGYFLSMANLVHGAINHNKIQANKQIKIIQTFTHKNYNKDI